MGRGGALGRATPCVALTPARASLRAALCAARRQWAGRGSCILLAHSERSASVKGAFVGPLIALLDDQVGGVETWPNFRSPFPETPLSVSPAAVHGGRERNPHLSSQPPFLRPATQYAGFLLLPRSSADPPPSFPRARHGVRLRLADRSESAFAAGTMNPSLATPRDREEVCAVRGSAPLAGDRLGEGWVADVACVVAAGEALGWFMCFFCLYDGGLAGGWPSLMCGALVRGGVVADPGVLLWPLLWMCACFVLVAVCWLPPCRWPRNGPRAVILVLVLPISVFFPALCYPFRASALCLSSLPDVRSHVVNWGFAHHVLIPRFPPPLSLTCSLCRWSLCRPFPPPTPPVLPRRPGRGVRPAAAGVDPNGGGQVLCQVHYQARLVADGGGERVPGQVHGPLP